MLEHKKLDKELLLFINVHHNAFPDFVMWCSSSITFFITINNRKRQYHES